MTPRAKIQLLKFKNLLDEFNIKKDKIPKLKTGP